jgi:dipeptidyl aminopeptidase/acylaminoacyl peptidase
MVSSDIERLVTLPEIGHPTVSPDGERVAVYYTASGRNEVHVIDCQTGNINQWSDGGVPNHMQWPLMWSNDSESVYVHIDEAGDEGNDIYALAASGALHPVLETDGQTNLHAVAGERLLVTSTHEGQMNLYTYDCQTETLQRRATHTGSVWEATLSTDGRRIAYATNETDDALNQDVYLLDTETHDETPRKLAVGEEGSKTIPADWGPDGTSLLLGDDSTGRACVYDIQTDEVSWYGDGSVVESPACFQPDGSGFYVERMRDAVIVPARYDVETGVGTPLELSGGVAGLGWRSNRVIDEDRILVTYTTPTRRKELLVYDHKTDSTRSLLERDYGGFSPEEFANAEYIRVESDGVPETAQAAIEHEPSESLDIGALLYDSGERPSPLIVKVHGGPRRMDRRAFNRRVQFLCALGYSVLQVNYRGSAGRGRAFADTVVGDFGGAEQGDIATVTEHVIETREWIDSDRIGVYGGSYGGYSTYWQLLQYPDLYDAGAAVVGMTDLLDAYEQVPPNFQTDYFERYLGAPEDNEQLYRERSPVTHAENLSAPLLIAHGTNDPRVPISQARRFRDALLEHGLTEGESGAFEYHELTERGHNTVNTDQRIQTATVFADFLERRL